MSISTVSDCGNFLHLLYWENGMTEVQMAEGSTAIAQNNSLLLFNNIQRIQSYNFAIICNIHGNLNCNVKQVHQR